MRRLIGHPLVIDAPSTANHRLGRQFIGKAQSRRDVLELVLLRRPERREIDVLAQ